VLGQIGRFLHYFTHQHTRSLGHSCHQTPICKTPRPHFPKSCRFRLPRLRLSLASITDLAGYFHLAAESAPLRHSCRPRASNTPSVDSRHPIPRSHFRSLPITIREPYRTFPAYDHYSTTPCSFDTANHQVRLIQGGSSRNDSRPENQIIQ
jgi:hypothetical protein